MALNDWWAERAEEKYWMVAPAKGALGPALAAPRHVEGARLEWTREIVSLVQPGDTLFVWDRTPGVGALTAWGRALGPLGTENRALPRGRGRAEHWIMPVSDTLPLARPIDLAALRKVGGEVDAVRSSLQESTDGPIYFPFIGSARSLTPVPGYLSKFPRDLFALLNSRYGFDFSL